MFLQGNQRQPNNGVSLEKYAVRADRETLVAPEELDVVKVGPDVSRARTELEGFPTIRRIPEATATTDGPCLVVVLNEKQHQESTSSDCGTVNNNKFGLRVIRSITAVEDETNNIWARC